MTENEYITVIKPFFENIKKFLKNKKINNFQKGERLFVENTLIKLVQNETAPAKIYAIVSKTTPKEREICLKYGINFQAIEQLLENE